MQMRPTPFILAALAFMTFSLPSLPVAAQDAPKPADAAPAAENPKPAEATPPAEAPKPSDAVTPADAPKPAEGAASEDAPKPTQAPAPAEVSKPAEAATPAETPKPAEAAAPAASIETPKPAAAAAKADELPCRHALSLVTDPKYPADFKHFDWVNPDAPKGGTLHQWAEGTFDTLNRFSDKGVQAIGLGLIDDGLFASSPDEPGTEYGLIAECASYPADYSWVSFKLRPEAKFHDGTPVTPEDVIFSFEN